jgi:ribosomal-protein-alanine N-acetyltransferase
MVFLGQEAADGLALSYQFHPDTWGRGVAQEACRAVLGYAQTGQLSETVFAETQAANKRSRRLLQALGFEESKKYKKFGAPQILYAVDLPTWAP